MFKMPKKNTQSCGNISNNKNSASNKNNMTNSTITNNNNNNNNQQTVNRTETLVFENGTLLGAVNATTFPNGATQAPETSMFKNLIVPEIIISASYSNNSLHRSRSEVSGGQQQQQQQHNNNSKNAVVIAECRALLEEEHCSDSDVPREEFEQFVLNRSCSTNNMLDASIGSRELHRPETEGDSAGANNGSDTCTAAPELNNPNAAVIEMLNSSVCSRESRESRRSKRTRRKHKSKTKCSSVTVNEQRTAATPQPAAVGTAYPPQYTAIFLDSHRPHHHHLHRHNAGAANAMGQLASAAAPSAFINVPVGVAGDYSYQLFQQQPIFTNMSRDLGQHINRPLLEAGAVGRTGPQPMCAGMPDSISGDGAGGAMITTTTNSGITPPLRSNFRKWFSRPSLPFVIGILALGGVACTLGGIVLGSTGLIEHSTQYLSAALLMIGIGVSLLVISGAIWRLSLPDDVDECPCYRHMELCRSCNSPYCSNRLLPGSYLYPEFQHRPPPPSYLTSLNECAAMGLLFHPAAAQPQQGFGQIQFNTPPPLYRSTNSLSAHASGLNDITVSAAATLAAQPQSSHSNSIMPAHDALTTMSVVMENLHAQTQPQTKEINYLELD